MNYVILCFCHISIFRFRVVIGLRLGLERYADIKMVVLPKMRRSHFYISQTELHHFLNKRLLN